MSESAIRLDRVSVQLPGSDRLILRDVSLAIPEGDLVLVVGRTGAGKSTLLGAMCGRVPHFTGGTLRGRVDVLGRDTRSARPRDLADLVGVVSQDPLAGFVTDTVEEELAYGVEQLGLSPATMRKRVEETLDVLGIADLRHAALGELSGGQQQRVAIGAVLTAHPKVLVLDEPTSALDPTGADDVLATITRLVHDLGLTVVVAEHRIERALHYADLVAHVGVDGRVEVGSPAAVMESSDVAPPVVDLGRYAAWTPLPLSIRDARRRADTDLLPRLRASDATRSWTGRTASGHEGARVQTGSVLRAQRVVVRYPGDVVAVAGVTLDIHGGEVCALMGRNGSGKSSLLWALQGSGRMTSGSVVAADGRAPAALTPADRRALVGMVPQTPSDLLHLDTVGAECRAADAESRAPEGMCAAYLARLAPGVGSATHPRDLSEGQKLSLALAVQLTADPRVVLLDEPTRGLDYAGKRELAGLLRDLAARGRGVVVSSHDVEFVAQCADRVVLLGAGEVVADGPTREIVTASPAFAPQVAKVTGPGPWLTVDDVRQALDGSDS